MGSRTVGRSQTGAQIARVRHAVEYQQHRRSLYVVEQRFERNRREVSFCKRNDALMTLVPAQPVEAYTFDQFGADIVLLGQTLQLTHARIMPALVDIKLGYRVGRTAQSTNNDVKSV